MASKFIPRQVFPHYASLPRSYFLGHHRAGLDKMKKMLSTIDYVIECRDFRVPITSINPMFEEALGEKSRLIVYTKRDLGGDSDATVRMNKDLTRKLDPKSAVFFSTSTRSASVAPILKFLRTDVHGPDKLVACRVMVVGMPNVGKSTLINSLRNEGVNRGKAVKTGGQPGITRKIGTPIKIVEREEASDVYILDTPGVFVPYMPDPERMLKLALCGCVKDAVISPVTIADYLLYHANLHNPRVYEKWSEPTNDIIPLIEHFARHAGLLAKGGQPNMDLAALSLVQKWRAGELGKFVLDDLRAEHRARRHDIAQSVGPSMTQALKAVKAERLAKQKRREAN